MDLKSTKNELESAYKSLEKADRQIKNLLIERKQLKMTLSLLEGGGFIADGKQEEAADIARSFLSS